MTLLSSNMAIGAIYHLSNEKARNNNDDHTMGRCMLDLAEWMAREHVDKGSFKLSKHEHILVLLAVNSAKYAILEQRSPSKCNYGEICEEFNMPHELVAQMKQTKTSRDILKTTIILLDYLEFVCPKSVRDEWLKHKNQVTSAMFNDMVDMVDEMED